MILKDGELPKGMLFTGVVDVKTPKLLNLRNGNYIAAIYQALELLPVEIRVDKCLVLENHGIPPKVRLTLQILGEKEEVG